MIHRNNNDPIADGATLATIAARLRLRRQTVHRLEQNAIRKLWRHHRPQPPPGERGVKGA